MFTEDLTEFFDTNSFAVAATIDGATVNGILDKEYVEVSAGRVDIVGYKPTFTCATSDVSDVDNGTMVSISGESEIFTIAHIENDGTGVSKVILEEI